MRKIKSEKGAITILVLVSVLFMVSFLISAYVIIGNKVQAQKEIISGTKGIYENYNLEDIYNSYFGKNIIPISNVEQLLAIGTGQDKIIDGEYYNFSNDENTIYLLTNDIEFNAYDEESLKDENADYYWIPVGDRTDFLAEFEGLENSIKVTYKDSDEDYTIIYSQENNFSEPKYDINIKVINQKGNLIEGAIISVNDEENENKGETTISVKRKQNTTISVKAEGYTDYVATLNIENPSKVANQEITLIETEHKYGEWTVQQAATCESAGLEVRECIYCGEKETRTIAALGHNYTSKEVLPSYSGRGYILYTCSRCGKQYTENTSKELVIIDGLTWTSSNWSYEFNNSSQSGFWESGFGGKVSPNKVSVVVSYVGNYGAAWTGPINLTDAEQVVIKYTQWDNLYKSAILSSNYQKGINKTTLGIADAGDLVQNETFLSGKYQTTTFTRSSDSDSVKTSTATIDVSELTGDYYIKIYVSHKNSKSGGDLTAYTAYTGLDNIKIIYK